MELGIAITLKQEFKLLGYKYACNNNLKQNLNNLKYWDKHGQKCNLPCLIGCSQTASKSDSPKSSKSIRENKPNSNKIQINYSNELQIK